MSLCVNDSGLTFSYWHEQAGYTIQWMSRCDMRFFALLERAWRRGDNPDDWKGAVKVLGVPWN